MQPHQSMSNATKTQQNMKTKTMPPSSSEIQMKKKKNPTLEIYQETPEINAFLDKVSQLLTAAAKNMGADEQLIDEILETYILTVNDLPMVIIPILENINGSAGIMLLVDTGVKIGSKGNEDMARVLGYSAGLLPTFNSSVAASPEGNWTLQRLVKMEDLTSESLVQNIKVTRDLVDTLWA